jgi:hypothetical protein
VVLSKGPSARAVILVLAARSDMCKKKRATLHQLSSVSIIKRLCSCRTAAVHSSSKALLRDFLGLDEDKAGCLHINMRASCGTSHGGRISEQQQSP